MREAYRCHLVEGRLATLIILAILATGCTDEPSSGEGIVTEEFSISDSELRPSQEAILELTVTNYNDGETSLKQENIELFNTGQLNISNKECTPSEIGSSTEGLNPKINCRWSIEAPGEEFISGFSSKTIPFNLMYTYNTTLESENPLSIKVSDSIAESGTDAITKEFSNNDMEVSMETINPVPLDETRGFEAEIKTVGSGTLEGSFQFNYEPKELFSDCPKELEPIEGETSFECSIGSEVTGSQKVFFSTSYKYQRVHNKVIEVVDD